MTHKCALKWVFMCTAIVLSLVHVPVAGGSGFAIYTQGASSLGQGAATVAHAEDPTSSFFNPALISTLDGTQVEAGTTLIFPSRTFTSDITGQTFKTKDSVFFPSTFFATHKFNEYVSAGLGVFNPFGLGTEWPDDWEGRYIATVSELTTYDFNPMVAFRLAPWMSIGVGMDFLLLDANLEKKINLSPLGLPDVGQKFKGDGNGVGYSLGILIEPTADISIGASYRSEIKVGVDGDATFDLPDMTPPQIAALFPDTSGMTDIVLPQRVHFGVQYKGFSPLTFELAARWEGWSSFDRLLIQLDRPVAGSSIFVTERNWEDAWSGNVGLKYQLNDMVALLAGYLYQGNPVPDSTFDPSIPDADGHLFTVGTHIRYKSFKGGLAYGYQVLLFRTKNNAVDDNPYDGIINPVYSATGKYDTNLHMVGISLSYVF